MANAVGQIQEAIWRDSDFRNLSRRAQTMYTQLLSQAASTPNRHQGMEA
jgi:hypothetical protein